MVADLGVVCYQQMKTTAEVDLDLVNQDLAIPLVLQAFANTIQLVDQPLVAPQNVRGW